MAIGKPSETRLRRGFGEAGEAKAPPSPDQVWRWGFFFGPPLLRQGYAGRNGVRMATFAEQMVEKLQAILLANAGETGTVMFFVPLVAPSARPAGDGPPEIITAPVS